MTRSRPASRAAGFSFMEILVVMGIIAVLVGLSVGIFKIVGKKGPEVKTRALLMKMRTNIDSWRGAFKAWPPSDLNKLNAVTGAKYGVGKAQPPNDANWGIESLVQCLLMPGYDHNAEIDEDLRGDAVTPKPWRNPNGAFAQQGAYQIYSMGEDGMPNTDDDLKAWTSN